MDTWVEENLEDSFGATSTFEEVRALEYEEIGF